MALLSRFFGGTVANGAGFAFGRASSPVLSPAVEKIRQEAWRTYPDYPLEPGVLATGVAQGQVDPAWAADEALNNGVNGERFARLVDIANTGPGMAAAFDLWRRGVIPQARFEAALKRGGIEDEWIADLVKTHDVLLTPAELANAVVQGHLTQDAAAVQAEAQGVTADRFDVLVQNTGLPPGPETLLAWLRRGIIDQAEFEQGVREGHTKTKYIPFYEAALQPLLSAATGVRLYLKGWYTKAQRDALGAQWGYSSQQMEDWFLSEGRPATAHQIHIGYARGAKLAGAANEIDAIRTSVKQSDIRPEYADLIVAGRYTYPSAFVLRGLVESGALSRDDGYQALIFSGWEPTFAAKVADSWAGATTGAATDAHLTKAQTHVWNATHRSYVARESGAAAATTALEAAGVPAATVAGVLNLWNAERDLIHAQLSPAQVKKAVKEAVPNPLTGLPWTQADGVQALLDRGFSQADATTLLSE